MHRGGSYACPGRQTHATGYTVTMRALSAIRLSVLTDETTSPERQRAATSIAAAAVGAHIIGEAVDLGVSASKTSPFDRPELGKWLAQPGTFDAIVWWRFDRAVRSMRDLNLLADWAADHHKVLVFAEGPGGRLMLDFRSGIDLVTRLLLQVFAFAAEFEAASIRDRVIGAQAALRTMPLRWRGSKPPYGYMPEELPNGGWTLVPDPEAIAVIERIVAALMGGATVTAVAAQLNVENVPSPRDYWSLKNGRSVGGNTGGAGFATTRDRFCWSSSVVNRLLRNPVLLGWKMSGNQPVRDSSGAPILAAAEPILSREEFDTIGALLDARKVAMPVRKDTNSLLLGVIHCASCGGRMYLNAQSGRTPSYKCSAHQLGKHCAAPCVVRGTWADEYAERKFLAAVGALRLTHRKVIPGYDPGAELAATQQEQAEHLSIRHIYAGNPLSLATWEKQARALTGRITELLSREATPERVELVDTGRSYSEAWGGADTAGRRAMLIEAGAYLSVGKGLPGGWRQLDESRVKLTLREPFFADAALELEGVDYE